MFLHTAVPLPVLACLLLPKVVPQWPPVDAEQTMTKMFIFQQNHLPVLAYHVSMQTAGMLSFGSSANLSCLWNYTDSQREALGRISRNTAVPFIMKRLIWSLLSRLPRQILLPC